MIALCMPATVRRDRHIGHDAAGVNWLTGGPTNVFYGDTTLVMVFDDDDQLAEIRSVLNGQRTGQ